MPQGLESNMVSEYMPSDPCRNASKIWDINNSLFSELKLCTMFESEVHSSDSIPSNNFQGAYAILWPSTNRAASTRTACISKFEVAICCQPTYP